MNHIYRVVFNHSLGLYQCVSEISKARGKKGVRRLCASVTAIVLFGLSSSAFAKNINYNDAQTHTVTDSQISAYDASGDSINNRSTLNAERLHVQTDSLVIDNATANLSSGLLVSKNQTVEARNNATVLPAAVLLNSGTINLDNSELTLELKHNTPTNLIQNPTISLGSGGIGDTANLNLTNKSRMATAILKVGEYGQGALTADNGSTINLKDEYAIIAEHNSGTLTLSGQNTSLTGINAPQIAVGYGNTLNPQAHGTLNIQDGARVEVGTVRIGYHNKNTHTLKNQTYPHKGIGTVNVKDTGSTLQTNELTVGKAGEGHLNVQNGASVTTDTLTIAAEAGVQPSTSTVTLDGADTTLNITGLTKVGVKQPAKLTVSNQAHLNATGNIIMAYDPEGTGELIIDNAQLTTPLLSIGASNKATADIRGMQSTITIEDLKLGDGDNSNGTLTATTNANINVAEKVSVGNYGQGNLSLDNAQLNTKNLASAEGNGQAAPSEAAITLTNNANLTATEGLSLSSAGTANLTADNSHITANNLTTATHENSKSTLTLNNSQLAVKETLTLGDGGHAELTANNQSTLHAQNLAVAKQANSTAIFALDNSSLNVDGTAILGDKGATTFTANNQSTVTAPTLTLGNGSAIFSDSTLTTHAIRFNQTTKPFNLTFNNSTLKLTDNATDLFSSSASQPINITGSFNVDTQGHNSTVHSNAQFRGTADFHKQGTGTLTLNSDSKQWNGKTHIHQGILKLVGDYTMTQDEKLAIDLNSMQDYGKLEVEGRADFSQGKLTLHPKGEFLKDLFTETKEFSLESIANATTSLQNFNPNNIEFKNNSPLFEFETEVKDNALNINFKPPAIVYPEPPAPQPQSPTPMPQPVPPEATPTPPQPELQPPVPMPAPQPKPPVSKPPALEPMPAPKPQPPVQKPKPIPQPELPTPMPAPQLPIPTPTPQPPAPKPMSEPVPQPRFVPMFSSAAEQQHAEHLLSLTHQLDDAYLSVLQQGSNNPLGIALLSDSNGLKADTVQETNKNLTQISKELQPLLQNTLTQTLYHQSQPVQQFAQRHILSSHSTPLWIDITNQQSLQNSINQHIGYQQQSQGLAVSLGHSINQNRVDIALAHNHGTVKALNIPHQSKISHTQAVLSAARDIDATTIYGNLQGGYSIIDGKRHLSLNNRTAHSHYHSHQFGAGIGIQHQWNNLTPFVQLQYQQTHTPAHQEKGADAYNLSLAAQRHNQLTTTAGVHFKQKLNDKLTLNASVSANHHNQSSRTQQAQFTHIPNTQFSIQAPPNAKTSANTDIGISYQITPNSNLSFHYDKQWQKNYRQQNSNLSLKIYF